MLNLIFPSSFGNEYRGHQAALWIFYFITVMTIGRSLAHIFLPDGGAQSIATIPLDQFTTDGAATVVSLFSLWGLSQLLLGFVMLLAALRYRSMIPLIYILIFLEYGGRMVSGSMKPLVTVDIPPGATGNLVLIVLSIAGLLLATRERKANIQ